MQLIFWSSFILKVRIWLFLSSKFEKTEFSWKTTWISPWPCYLRNRNWSRLRKTKPWSDPVRSSNVESTGGVPSKLTGCHAVGVRPRFVVFLCLIPSDLKDLSLFWYWPSVPRVRAQSADTKGVRSSGPEVVVCIQCWSIHRHYGGEGRWEAGETEVWRRLPPCRCSLHSRLKHKIPKRKKLSAIWRKISAAKVSGTRICKSSWWILWSHSMSCSAFAAVRMPWIRHCDIFLSSRNKERYFDGYFKNTRRHLHFFLEWARWIF